MKDGLAGGLSVINPYIETVRFVFFLQETAAFPEETPKRAALVRCGRKKRSDMAPGYDQHMAGRNGKPVVNGDGQLVFEDRVLDVAKDTIHSEKLLLL